MILDRFRLDDNVAMVRVAGRGSGEVCALAFGEMDASVVCAARALEQIEDTADRVRGLGSRALAVPCDVVASGQPANRVERAHGGNGGTETTSWPF